MTEAVDAALRLRDGIVFETCVVQQLIKLTLEDPRSRRSVWKLGQEEVVFATGMCRPPLVGEGNIPEEIWLIKTEPTSRPTVPVEPDEILDRRKQMEGNCALMNQLGILNEIFLLGGYTPELLRSLQWEAPVRIPKMYDEWPEKPYTFRTLKCRPSFIGRSTGKRSLIEEPRTSTC